MMCCKEDGGRDTRDSRRPASGRIAGIDYGTKRIGIAISDAAQQFASPHAVRRRQSPAADADYFRQLMAREEIVQFVVGLPVHMSGDESQKSREARTFGKWLAAETSTPVEYFDERYTSWQADEILAHSQLSRDRRRQRRDMIAAQVLLASYLETGRDAEHIDPL